MNEIGYRVVPDFNRPPVEIVEGFRGIPVSNIDDCMSRCAAVDWSIKPVNKARLLGPAFTVYAQPGDNMLFYYAIEKACPGDVIVITDGGFSNRALCGEIMVTLAKKRGIAGFLIDGAIRDWDVLSKMDFPIFAKNASPNGPFKNGPGEVNVPISLGGRVIFPGDIIIGDADGVVIVRPQDAEETLRSAREVMKKESEILRKLRETGEYDFSWLHEKLRQIDCR